MIEKNTPDNVVNVKPVVLVAPLDWGLGHATRCIPIINECLNAGFEVIIASEGPQAVLLKSEFPDLDIIYLKGYRIRYEVSKWMTIIKILLQVPKILIAINHEKKWLRRFTNKKHLDVIISDNRFGLYSTGIHAVFITHQLNIKTALGKRADRSVNRFNHRFINKFKECWVPDTADNNKNMSGELSHPPLQSTIPVSYIGTLSRIKKEPVSTNKKLLVLLSGPEPQRSLLEKKIWKQLEALSISSILVRGLPGSSQTIPSSPNIEVFNHLPGKEIQQLINASEIILSRSGYSTIMELLPLNKKCIFIPTPGQAEQEYLAAYLTDKGWACSSNQDDFSLPQLIENARSLQLPDLSGLFDSNKLSEVVTALKPEKL